MKDALWNAVPLNEASLDEVILRTLGICPVTTLDYLWHEAYCLPGETIPRGLLENDDDMQDALTRLAERTGLARKTHKGWRIDRKVYNAVTDMTADQAAQLDKAEEIRQLVTGALEHYGLVSYRRLGSMFEKLGVPEQSWRTVCDDLFEAAQQTLTCNCTDSLYLVHPIIDNAQQLDDARRANGVYDVQCDPLNLRERHSWLPGDADLYYPVLEWLSHCGVSPEDGAVLLQNGVYAMQMSADPEDLIAEIEEATSDGEIPVAVRGSLMRMAMDIPQWLYGGATLRSLEPAEN